MSNFVERLRTLKIKRFITEVYLMDLVERGKINQEEFNYINASE